MRIIQKLKHAFGQQARSAQYLAEIVAGIDNEQRLLNDKLTQAIVALTDISNVLRSKLDAVVAGSKHEQRLLNDRLGTTIAQLNDVANVLRSKLDGVLKGLDDNARLCNSKFDAVIAGLNNQTRLLNDKLDALIASSTRHSQPMTGQAAASAPPRESGEPDHGSKAGGPGVPLARK